MQFALSSQGYNRYTYANNNPLSFTDPSGYFFKSVFRKFKRLVKKVFKSKVVRIAAAAAFAYWGGGFGAEFLLGSGADIAATLQFSIAKGAASAAFGRLYAEEMYHRRVRPLYETQHEAALAASKEIYGISLERDLEYGGLIYQTPGSKFSFTQPIEGTYKSVLPEAWASFGVPYDARQVAYYHSHAGGKRPGLNYENFSGFNLVEILAMPKDTILMAMW